MSNFESLVQQKVWELREEADRRLQQQKAAKQRSEEAIAAYKAFYRDWVKEAGLSEDAIAFDEASLGKRLVFRVAVEGMELVFWTAGLLAEDRVVICEEGPKLCSAFYEGLLGGLRYKNGSLIRGVQRFSSLIVSEVAKERLRKEALIQVGDRFLYALSDGEIHSLSLMNDEEIEEADAEAQVATDGNFGWHGPLDRGALERLAAAANTPLEGEEGPLDLENRIAILSMALGQRPLPAQVLGRGADTP